MHGPVMGMRHAAQRGPKRSAKSNSQYGFPSNSKNLPPWNGRKHCAQRKCSSCHRLFAAVTERPAIGSLHRPHGGPPAPPTAGEDPIGCGMSCAGASDALRISLKRSSTSLPTWAAA
eukprot:Amastigsp_a683260_15.p3 type:complete len:117 gc:universal Amastigsp_a683260_15:506-156(-)